MSLMFFGFINTFSSAFFSHEKSGYITRAPTRTLYNLIEISRLIIQTINNPRYTVVTVVGLGSYCPKLAYLTVVVLVVLIQT